MHEINSELEIVFHNNNKKAKLTIHFLSIHLLMYQDNKMTFTAHLFDLILRFSFMLYDSYLDREVWEREQGT